MSDFEYVTLKIKVPKPITVFVENYTRLAGFTAKEFWEKEAVSLVDQLLNSVGAPYLDRDELIKMYGLGEILKDC